MKSKLKYMILAVLLASFTGGLVNALGRERRGTKKLKPMVIQISRAGKLPSFNGATQWFNSPPLTPAGLRGKVVLVEFWTYTCINWRRTLPYVRAWAEKYRDQGLVVIGVHTPEFSFEKNADNVRWALKDMHIGFPVAMDNSFAVWRAFDNQYWPALYFADANGVIRHHQFGEGNYEQSERVIQRLLSEAGVKVSGDVGAGGRNASGKDGGEEVSAGDGNAGEASVTGVKPEGVELAADWAQLGSGENYLGYERTEHFASPGGAIENRRVSYAAPGKLRLNEWALSGNWTMGPEANVGDAAGGRIVYRFHARDVNLIMGPGIAGSPVRFRVLIDGQAPGAAHGVDVDSGGSGMVTNQRMYQLIRQPAPVPDREFVIEFIDPGVEVFDFTFG